MFERSKGAGGLEGAEGAEGGMREERLGGAEGTFRVDGICRVVWWTWDEGVLFILL